MIRDEIVGRVRTNLDDAGVFYAPADLNDSVQDGYAEVAAFTGCIFKATSISLTGNLTYYDFGALISDFLAVSAIFNPATKRWMNPVSLNQLEEIREDWELAIGNPFLFWPINFRFVAIYPKLTTSTGSLYVFYHAQADTLSGASIPAISAEYQAILEEYSTMDLFEQAEEFTKAGINFKNYLETLKELKQARGKIRLPDYMPRLA